ncbi:MAG: cytochrome-c oxidase, cbb3-type subunit II [Phycisphaerales bacterium]
MHTAPALAHQAFADPTRPVSELTSNVQWGKALDVWSTGWWHRIWERKPLKFTVFTLTAVAVASLFEIIPTFLIRSNVPTIASVKPYTPLELAGRDIYVAEGCYNCHSQMVRPIYAETKRYGEYSKPGEFVYDHPFQWGSRRIGPDLAREGGMRSDLWHLLHFRAPDNSTPGSIMPRYPWLLNGEFDYSSVQARVNAMAMLGVPYGQAVVQGEAEKMARAQAKTIADNIRTQGAGSLPADVPADLENRKVVALIAYLQRLGTDISKPAEPERPQPAPPAPPSAPSATTTAAK